MWPCVSLISISRESCPVSAVINPRAFLRKSRHPPYRASFPRVVLRENLGHVNPPDLDAIEDDRDVLSGSEDRGGYVSGVLPLAHRSGVDLDLPIHNIS